MSPRRMAAMAVAVLAGVGVAVQSRINGELGQRLADGVAAALVSFGTGLLILAAVAAASPRVRRGLARLPAAVRGARLRRHHLLGGVFGAMLVASQGLTVGLIGVAVFSVAVVAGQLVGALAVDRAGVGPAGRVGLSARRLVAAGLALVAVALAVSGALSGSPALLALAVLPALAGAGTAYQQAINGRVSVAAGGALPAATVNFTVGTAALLPMAAATAAAGSAPEPLPAEPWLYAGGAVGVLFIAAAAALVRVLGVLLLGLCTVAGQVGGAVVVDAVSPAVEGGLSPLTVAAAALTLVAVAVGATGTAPPPGREAGPAPAAERVRRS